MLLGGGASESSFGSKFGGFKSSLIAHMTTNSLVKKKKMKGEVRQESSLSWKD